MLKTNFRSFFLTGQFSAVPLLTALFCLSAPAQEITVNAWINPISELWHDAASWSVGLPPFETNSIVAISNFNTKTITANADTPATNLYIRNLFVTALQNRVNTLLLTNLVAPLEVTRGFTMSNNAALQIYNSTLRVDGRTLGEFTLASANGTLHSGSVLLTNTAVMKIGNGPGTSSFTVSNGTLRAGSDLLIGGVDSSIGRLTNVAGNVSVGFQLTLADHPQSTGTVMMLNGTLTATNPAGNTRIGQRGYGSFVISNGVAAFDDVSVGRQPGGQGNLLVAGGSLTCGTLSIGRFAGSTGAVSVVAGSLAVTDGSLYVGREGVGTFTQEGGTVSASQLIVPGDTNTASGLAVLSGGQSYFPSGLMIGSAISTGEVFLAGGSLLCTNSTTSSTSVVARGTSTLNSGYASFDVLEVPTSAGQVTFNGGILSTIDMVVSNGVPFYVGDGVNPAVLELRGGTARFGNGLVIRANAQLIGCGTVIGGITLDGGVNSLTSCPAGPPTAYLINPHAGDEFLTPITIPLAAVARDPGGSIAKVEFYQGATKLGEDTTFPYSFNWASVPVGNYTLTARSTDNSANTKTSSIVNIVVADPPPPPIVTDLNVTRADDNMNQISYLPTNDPVLDLNTTAEENKVPVESGDSSDYWEFRFANPDTNGPNPIVANVTLQYRPETDWVGTFTAQFFNDSFLLASVNLPASGAGGGTLTSNVWDLSDIATTLDIIAAGRVRVINSSDNGKKLTVSFARLRYGIANLPPVPPPIVITNTALVPGGMRFSFTSTNSVAYAVEFKDSLSNTSWQLLTNLTATGALTHVTNAPTAAPAQRYYRVRTQP